MNGLKHHIQKNGLGYLLVLPALCIILFVNIYPMFNGVVLTFQNSTIYNMTSHKDFVGFDNYMRLLTKDKEFISILGFTAVYTLSVVLGSYLIGLGLALLVNRTFIGRGLFRSFVLLPWVLPTIVAACAFMNTLNTNGIVNSLLISLGWIKDPILFFADPALAKYTVILMGIWKGFPFMVLTLLAGLQTIPTELNEAAAIDGANKFTNLMYVTLPLMKQISMIALMLRFIWTFNNFEQIYLLTQGGPMKSTMAVSIYAYRMAFINNELSYSATITVTVMIVVSVLIAVFQKLDSDKDARRH